MVRYTNLHFMTYCTCGNITSPIHSGSPTTFRPAPQAPSWAARPQPAGAARLVTVGAGVGVGVRVRVRVGCRSQLAQLAVEEQQAEEDGERAEVELFPLLVDPVRHGLGVGKAQSRRRWTGLTAAAQPPAGPLAAQLVNDSATRPGELAPGGPINELWHCQDGSAKTALPRRLCQDGSAKAALTRRRCQQVARRRYPS